MKILRHYHDFCFENVLWKVLHFFTNRTYSTTSADLPRFVSSWLIFACRFIMIWFSVMPCEVAPVWKVSPAHFILSCNTPVTTIVMLLLLFYDFLCYERPVCFIIAYFPGLISSSVVLQRYDASPCSVMVVLRFLSCGHHFWSHFEVKCERTAVLRPLESR